VVDICSAGKVEHPVEALTVLFFVLKTRGAAPLAADVDIGGFWRKYASSSASLELVPPGTLRDTRVFDT